MPNTKKGTDEDQHPFQLRSGIGNTDRWRGVRKGGSPAVLLPGEIRDGVNIRPDTEGYVCRGGQEKLSADALVFSIDGIFEGGDPGAP